VPLAAIGSSLEGTTPVTRRVEQVMGLPISLALRGRHTDDAAAHRAWDEAVAVLRHVDAVFSTYREDSVVSRLRRGEVAPADVPDDVREVLALCEQARDRTDGWFDHELPGPDGVRRLDPSGVVKGWAVQRAADGLRRAGATSFCIHAGGDVVVAGEPAPGTPWRVGIQHPERRDALAAVLALRDAAVATSGAYERGLHIVDPRTGRPPAGVLSATVVGPDLGIADAYATAAFALGPDGPAWTATLGGGFEALTILADGRVLSTAGMAALRAD
jgi:thiamine biosynthesis lipoprotein